VTATDNSFATATASLRERIGTACVSDAPEDRYRASMDNLRLSRLPTAVVRPAEEEHVGIVLRLANAYRVPVTTRGAGSATTGATTPLHGGWVLDLSAWTEVHIDSEAMMAFVQPGATIESIDRAARACGLAYPPDPGSKRYSTIGGAIACNAGGLRGAKYGVTRDYVIALEGFLPSGDFVRWGTETRKFVSGYNMRDLWIGSEGTLGVVTGAILRLVPAPPARRTLLATFDDERAALTAARAILARHLVPSVMEFLDRQSVACTERMWARTVDPSAPRAPGTDAPAALLIEVDGTPESMEADWLAIRACIEPHARFLRAAENDEDAETLWTLRRSCSQAMFQLADTKLNEDVVVPLRHQIDLLDYTLELKAETGLPTPTFGHAADGNFHVHIMYCRDDPAQAAAAERGINLLMRRVVDLGGAITGEHGIGLAKSPFVALQHSRAEIEAMKAIKKALDPNNICNPGKIWEPFRVWDHPTEKVHMPWDHR